MSTKAKLNKLLKTKEDIKKAIQNKGGNVGDVFDEYPAAIKGLKSGRINVKDAKLKFQGSLFDDFNEINDHFDFTGVEDMSSMFSTGKSRKIHTKGTFIMPKSTTKEGYAFYGRYLDKVIYENEAYIDGPNDADFIKEVDITKSNPSFRPQIFYAETIKGDVDTDAYGFVPTWRNFTILPKKTSLTNYNPDSATKESLLDIINKLEVVTGNPTLSLSQEVVNEFTDDEIAIAINKGWTITPAKRDVIIVTDNNYSSCGIQSARRITPASYDISGPLSTTLSTHNLYYLSGEIGCNFTSGSNLRYIDVTINSNKTSCSQLVGVNGTSSEDGRIYPHKLIVSAKLKGDFSNVEEASYMFASVIMPYETLDVSNWNMENLVEGYNMFYNTDIKVTGLETWNPIKLNYLNRMFSYTTFEHLDLSNWVLENNVWDMYALFEGSRNLKSVKVPTITSDSYNVCIGRCFAGCESLESVDLSNWTFRNFGGGTYESSKEIFSGCKNLKEVKLFNTKRMYSSAIKTNFNRGFEGCENLKEVDFSPIDMFSNGLDFSRCFKGCKSLEKVIMPNPIDWGSLKTYSVSEMFDGVNTKGTFYYNPNYDYSMIIEQLPSTWKAVPITE